MNQYPVPEGMTGRQIGWTDRHTHTEIIVLTTNLKICDSMHEPCIESHIFKFDVIDNFDLYIFQSKIDFVIFDKF